MNVNANHEVTLLRDMHINFNFGPGVSLSELISTRPKLEMKMVKMCKRLYLANVSYPGICHSCLIPLHTTLR